MENSKIEWTKHTANLWIGCTEVHEGCDNCYARVLNHRWGHKNWGNDEPRREVKKVWNDFVKWQKGAAKLGEIHSVFVGSMMDIFEKPQPVVNSKGEAINKNTGAYRMHFFENIVPNSPNLRFLLLTKRPSNINKYIPETWKTTPPANVMFGTSPVNQETAKRLISQLLQVNGKRFLSVEPQLDKISFRWASWVNSEEMHKLKGSHWHLDGLRGIDWVICGGESGHGKRPFNPDWGRSLRDECKEANVPFFFKQMDKVQPIPEDLMIREFPKL